LARFLGRFVAIFECSQHVDASAAAMFTTGLASVSVIFAHKNLIFFSNNLGWMLGDFS
jgi:hypothetical protein